MKKIKILKHVGAYIPGQIIEVEDEVAEQLLVVNHFHNGHGIVESRRAMLAEDFDNIKELEIEELTAGEAAALGKKNIVDSSASVKVEEKKSKKK